MDAWMHTNWWQFIGEKDIWSSDEYLCMSCSSYIGCPLVSFWLPPDMQIHLESYYKIRRWPVCPGEEIATGLPQFPNLAMKCVSGLHLRWDVRNGIVATGAKMHSGMGNFTQWCKLQVHVVRGWVMVESSNYIKFKANKEHSLDSKSFENPKLFKVLFAIK